MLKCETYVKNDDVSTLELYRSTSHDQVAWSRVKFESVFSSHFSFFMLLFDYNGNCEKCLIVTFALKQFNLHSIWNIYVQDIANLSKRIDNMYTLKHTS